MALPPPADVDAYIAAFPTEQQAALRSLRAIIKATLPEAQETIKWRQPAYEEKTILVSFAGFKNHLNFYSKPSSLAAFAERLAPYETGKGSVQFSYGEPLPERLVADLCLHRQRQWQEEGITWM